MHTCWPICFPGNRQQLSCTPSFIIIFKFKDFNILISQLFIYVYENKEYPENIAYEAWWHVINAKHNTISKCMKLPMDLLIAFLLFVCLSLNGNKRWMVVAGGRPHLYIHTFFSKRFALERPQKPISPFDNGSGSSVVQCSQFVGERSGSTKEQLEIIIKSGIASLAFGTGRGIHLIDYLLSIPHHSAANNQSNRQYQQITAEKLQLKPYERRIWTINPFIFISFNSIWLRIRSLTRERDSISFQISCITLFFSCCFSFYFTSL